SHIVSSLILYAITPPTLRSTLFPYTTLFRSQTAGVSRGAPMHHFENKAALMKATAEMMIKRVYLQMGKAMEEYPFYHHFGGGFQDRKSTRLNSSHVSISYAVFCLKIKKTGLM